WAARGVSTRLLDRDAMREAVGAEQYLAGWQDDRAGCIQPLSFARALVRAALKAGAQIYGESRVTGIAKRGEVFEVQTTQGPTV
ncbi:FAD-dependent oxidoreductase, partial [Acinetobacter baumannii]